MNKFRWFSVMPAAILAWYAAVLSGLLLVSALGRLCPPEDLVSGQCMAWWYPYAERVVILFSVAASAFLVVVCAAAVAPSYRVPVAWVAYICGVLVAVFFVLKTALVGEFISAIISGLFGVFTVAKYLGRSMLPNNRLVRTPESTRHVS